MSGALYLAVFVFLQRQHFQFWRKSVESARYVKIWLRWWTGMCDGHLSAAEPEETFNL